MSMCMCLISVASISEVYLLFYVLAISNLISGRVLTCDSVDVDVMVSSYCIAVQVAAL